MPIGYNVIQPNGVVKKQRAADHVERSQLVEALLSKWERYCLNNWISWSGDIFSPENRVKQFLNGLSYFLLVGNTEGVVTDYKDIMNGKREIPISSCPSYVEDAVYGGGSTICPASPDEDGWFEQVVEKLEQRAAKVEKKKVAPPKRTETKSERQKKIRSEFGKCSFSYPVVDTEGCFCLNGGIYRISDRAVQYSSKQTPYGELYDMDHIVCVTAGDRIIFFDMDIFQQPDEWVTRIK